MIAQEKLKRRGEVSDPCAPPRVEPRGVPERRPWRRWAQVFAGSAVIIVLTGCSLISLKSPERPLSTRDLNARILTRQLSWQLWTAAARCAQDIAATERDPTVLENSLRWQIAVVAESRRAATQMAPMMSLLDTWALAVQMQAFAAEGAPGGGLFGTHAGAVREVSEHFAAEAEALARNLMAPREFTEYRSFVERYARDHPLQDLTFARASVVQVWSRERGAETRLVDSMGTIPEALTDVAERMQIYSDTVPSQVMRQTQLALQESGYSKSDIQSALKRLDDQLARLNAVAESTPELVHSVVVEVRQSLRAVLDQLEASSRATTTALRAERTALFADIRTEREAVVTAVDAQRKALALDAARIADQAVKSAGEQVRYLAGEVLLLLIVLTLIVLGLPFVAGYVVGRARPRP